MALNLYEVFRASEAQLQANLAKIRAGISHPGVKGAGVEEIVRKFLREVLPSFLGVGSGIVVDSSGQESRQIDVVIYDKAKTPNFLTSGESILFPCECVYFAIEVKTNLTSEEFRRCEENMDSFKRLDRSAYSFQNGPIIHTKTLFGKEWRTWPAIYLVWAFEASSYERHFDRLVEHRKSGRAVEKQIDTVFCLASGTLTNWTGELVYTGEREGYANEDASGSVSLLPESGSYVAATAGPSLFDFLALFSVLYNQADIGADFSFLPYHSGLLTGPLRVGR